MNAHLDAPVVVIGAGPAGLMAAEKLAQAGQRVIVCDGMASPARKFLLAGRGGLNLTHSEETGAFAARYGAASARLAPVLDAFPPDQLRRWSEALGEPTFIGTSGRVFPVSFKASPLLRKWLRRLTGSGVEFRLRHRFCGWSREGALQFVTPDGEALLRASAVVLALGGASWPRLGSDGAWTQILAARGVAIAPLRPSNCGFDVAWSSIMLTRFAGAPVKNIALSHGIFCVRGEALITRHGIEGGAVYALSSMLREAIASRGEAIVFIDLRPDVDEGELARRLAQPRKNQSLSTFLRKAAGLTPVAIGLMHEAGSMPAEAVDIAARIKRLPLKLTGARPINRAISSAGGVLLDELDAGLMLKRLPGVFVAGEMIDWEAPTGGYLLQACFATGFVAGGAAAAFVSNARQ